MPIWTARWTYVSFLTAIYWLFDEISPRSMATKVNTKSARYQQPFFHCSTIGDLTVAPTLGAQACVRQACTNRSASGRIGLRHPTCRACAQQVCANMVARKTKLIYTADNHPVLLPALAVPAQCEPACKEADLRGRPARSLTRLRRRPALSFTSACASHRFSKLPSAT